MGIKLFCILLSQEGLNQCALKPQDHFAEGLLKRNVSEINLYLITPNNVILKNNFFN